MPLELIFATGNQHKVNEVQAQLPSHILIKSLADLQFAQAIPETTGTITGNAKQKADFIFERHKTNVFAEDTGLEVEALNGQPGVDTAHYSGNRDAQKNMALLLKNMHKISNRNAQFRTVIALHWRDELYLFEGIIKGKIAIEQYGNQGFGYDPIFIPTGYDRTLAELSANEKNLISHRGKAVRKLIEFLNKTT